jgi:type I restriction enzyme R subunit
MEGIEQRKRKFLLVMATGTGKTRTAIALIDTLMRAGWISRALFLVDRIELRNQAVETIKEHTPNYSVWPNQNEKEFVLDRRLYVSTYPTTLNIVEEDQNSISPHFFDLIIVDESHRSIYNVYQNILNYFNAIVLGLTATPTDVIDHNTFEVFDCEDGLPSFAYGYDEAVKNIPKYLNDFEVLKISTKFQVEGIHKSTISIEDQKKLIAEGKDIEELNFKGTSLEKTVTNKGTNALIVKEIMEECIKDHNGVLPGKTIIFCITIKHARRIKEIFDQFYPQYKGELAKVIVSEDPRVYGKGGLLDQFKNYDLPRVALSVDMLDTGIDVREVVNLVFVKPVFSYTKFWQMIGRGTRVLDDNNLKPWCQTKDKFLIIDCWDNFEYFKLNPKGRNESNQLALPVRFFKTILDKLEVAQEKDVKPIVDKEILRLQNMVSLLPLNNVVVMDSASDLAKLNDNSFWDKIDESKTEFLNQTIAPIMRAISRVDFFEMRFQKDILETSITLLEGKEEEFKAMKEVIIAQIEELPLSINIIIKEKELIKQSLRESFWNSMNEEKLEEILQKLSPLMRYRKGINTTDNEEVLSILANVYSYSGVKCTIQKGINL